MILSESEKNRIKGLYGLVTEAETAPPPDESVLVAKKNPFNYEEYKGAIRGYSSDLKDGDLFTNTFLPFGDYSVSDYVKNSMDENFKGKDFRFISKSYDSINQYKDIKFYGPKIQNNITYYTYNNRVIMFFKKHMTKIDINLQSGEFKYFTNVGTGESVETNYTKLSKESENKILTILRKIFNIKNIPDECFEIRKIQREKTDF